MIVRLCDRHLGISKRQLKLYFLSVLVFAVVLLVVLMLVAKKGRVWFGPKKVPAKNAVLADFDTEL